MNDNIKRLNVEKKQINDELKIFKGYLDEFKELPIIQRYEYSKNKVSYLTEKELELDALIKEEEMKDCVHMFICTSPASELGNQSIHYCLRCGLTNLYYERIISEPLTPLQAKMEIIYKRTKMQGLKLRIISSDINFYKNRLREIEADNPYATDIYKGHCLEKIYREQSAKKIVLK